MISVCMIVKNEQQHLEQTLHSIADHFDDIVVVDTGSTDNTKAIAARYTDNVTDFHWVDDFSAARNYALSKAKHDWVLVIDADEVITTIDNEALQQRLSADLCAVGQVQIINLVNEEGGISSVTELISRLFNKTCYHYQGMIHEQLCHITSGLAPERRFKAPVTLLHSGYQKAVVTEKNKTARNVALLKKALTSSPEDSYLHYQLGRSYFMAEDYPQAVSSFETALALQVDFSQPYSAILIETYGYALLNIAAYEKALSLLDYEPYCPSTDFMFLKALILMNNGDLQGAVNVFLHCTTLPEGAAAGVNSFKACYNIAVIFECSDMHHEALQFYQQCGDYPPALQAIVRLSA